MAPRVKNIEQQFDTWELISFNISNGDSLTHGKKILISGVIKGMVVTWWIVALLRSGMDGNMAPRTKILTKSLIHEN